MRPWALVRMAWEGLRGRSMGKGAFRPWGPCLHPLALFPLPGPGGGGCLSVPAGLGLWKQI